MCLSLSGSVLSVLQLKFYTYKLYSINESENGEGNLWKIDSAFPHLMEFVVRGRRPFATPAHVNVIDLKVSVSVALCVKRNAKAIFENFTAYQGMDKGNQKSPLWMSSKEFSN